MVVTTVTDGTLDDPPCLKGPLRLFKGKGDISDRAACEAERKRVRLAIHALKRRFDETFGSRPPARLVLQEGGRIRWRFRARCAREQTLFDMTGPVGIAFLESLPAAARGLYLDFEEARARLAFEWSVIDAQYRSLVNWRARQEKMAALRLSLAADPHQSC